MPLIREAQRFPRAAIVTPHHLASAAGSAVLARGGNAVDAIVAANLALGVVAPYFCGYGGDLFAIVWDGGLHGYLGSGRSASTATPDVVRAATGNDEMPILGPLAVTVPGVVDGWFALLDRWGTRSFGDLATDALHYARDGFAVSTRAARESFVGYRPVYVDFPAWRETYGGVEPGTILRQPALARTIEALASGGPDAYYRGEIAEAIAGAVHTVGGALSTDDLAAHRGEWATPLVAAYRGVEVAELPAPTQGVTALEALRIIDGFERPIDAGAWHHLLIEAVKQALADRDAYVTDPAHMASSAEAMLGDDWVMHRRARIDPARAVSPDPGRPQLGGTAFLCAADGDGLLVSLIQSNFLAFGSGVHVRDWGINLNNRGSSFTLDAARANVLAPSKRPMHTLVPALALRDRRPFLVFGTMGADAQTQVHVQLLARIVDDAADPQAAIDQPRWRVEPQRWTVTAERRLPAEIVDGLRARGHEVTVTRSYDSGMGHAHAIGIGVDGYAAATDPRAEGAALGL